MRNIKILRFLQENINSQMKLLLILGGLIHLGFVILALIFGVYPIVWLSLPTAILFISYGILVRQTNFLFIYILTFLGILINTILMEYFLGTALGFPLYFFVMIPIATYIFFIHPSKKFQIAFFIIAYIINISAFLFFSQFFTLFTHEPTISLTARLSFYTLSSVGASSMIGFLSLYFILNSQMQYSQIQSQNNILMEEANRDMLTGLYNRRYMYKFLNFSFANSDRNFCLAMSDIDLFKNFNDQHGHDAGDLVLKTLPLLFIPFCEEEEIVVSRWGGEEFLFYFPFAPEKAVKIVEQIRENVEASMLSYNNQPLRITMTFGLSNANSHYSSVSDMIKAADINLYIGKNNGRNRVIL